MAIAAVLAVPLVVLPDVLFPYVVPKAVVLRIALGLGLGALFAAFATRGYELLDRSDWILAGWAFFILVSAVAGVLGEAPMRSIFGELERMWGVIMWFYLLVWYVLLRIIPREREWRWILTGSVAVASIVALYAALQRYESALGLVLRGASQGRPSGTLGNTSYLGIYLILNAGIALLLMARTRRAPWRLALAATTTLLVSVSTFTGARTAFVGLAVGSLSGLCVWIVASRREGKERVRIARQLGAAAAIALIGLSTLLIAGAQNPLVRRFSDLASSSTTLSYRFAVWGAGWSAFLEAPLLGIGPENFYIALSRNYPVGVASASSFWDRAHNGYLEILVASGIAGLVAYLAVWSAYFWTVRHAYLRGRASPAMAAILTGVGVTYLVYLLTWFDDISSSITLVLLLAYASNLRAGTQLAELGSPRPRPVRSYVLLGLGLAVLVLFTYQRGYAVWRTATETTAAHRARDVETRITHYERALDIGAVEGLVVAGLYTDFLRSFTPRVEELRESPHRAELLWDAIGRALVEVDRASRLDPHNETWWVDRSRLLLLAAELRRDRRYYEAAVESLQRAIELSPGRISLYHMMAELKLSAGDTGGAFDALRVALAMDPSAGETHYNLARAHAITGDLRASREAVQTALENGYVAKRAILVWHLNRLEESGDWPAAVELLGAYRQARMTRAGALPRLSLEDFEILSRRPVMELRLGRADDAVRSARELIGPFRPGRGTVRLFMEDVERGRGAAWEAYPQLFSAGRAFGGLALLDRLRR